MGVDYGVGVDYLAALMRVDLLAAQITSNLIIFFSHQLASHRCLLLALTFQRQGKKEGWLEASFR